MSAAKELVDFDAEGRNLLSRLNLELQQRGRGDWNALDSIFRNSETGGTIYVGNQSAAQNLSVLRSHNITHVVNCTHGPSKIANYHAGTLTYFEFAISNWHNCISGSDPDVLFAFVNPLFAFIDSALANGTSVLVHCLAGAHRAGTTGCLCLMHYANMDVSTAIASAKRLRPVIDPIGHLPELLNRYQIARRMKTAATTKS